MVIDWSAKGKTENWTLWETAKDLTDMWGLELEHFANSKPLKSYMKHQKDGGGKQRKKTSLN